MVFLVRTLVFLVRTLVLCLFLVHAPREHTNTRVAEDLVVCLLPGQHLCVCVCVCVCVCLCVCVCMCVRARVHRAPGWGQGARLALYTKNAELHPVDGLTVHRWPAAVPTLQPRSCSHQEPVRADSFEAVDRLRCWYHS